MQKNGFVVGSKNCVGGVVDLFFCVSRKKIWKNGRIVGGEMPWDSLEMAILDLADTDDPLLHLFPSSIPSFSADGIIRGAQSFHSGLRLFFPSFLSPIIGRSIIEFREINGLENFGKKQKNPHEWQHDP